VIVREKGNGVLIVVFVVESVSDENARKSVTEFFIFIAFRAQCWHVNAAVRFTGEAEFIF